MVTTKILIGIVFGEILIALLILFFLVRYLNKKHNKEVEIKIDEIEFLNKRNKELELELKDIQKVKIKEEVSEEHHETSSKSETNQWLENSKKALINKENLPRYEIQILQEEIKKRQNLKDDFSLEYLNPTITIEEIEGTYNIIGLNQNKEQSAYNGFLHLVKIGEKRVNAEWIIDGEQTQQGIGFYSGDTLIINFSYAGEDDNEGKTYKGVVAYKFINSVILTGFWSEKHGNDAYLGFEEGRKLINSESISYQAKMN